MRATTFILTCLWALPAVIFAQQDLISQLPACASSCFTSSVSNSTCGPTDFTCICASTTIAADVTACVRSACTIKEGLTTKNITDVVCNVPVRNRSKNLEATIYGVGALAAVAVLLRMIVKATHQGNDFGWDDYTIIASLVLSIACSSAMIACARSGLGQDIWKIDFVEVTEVFYTFYTTAIFYKLATSAVKISLLCLYLRIFPEKTFQRMTYACIVFNICVGLTFSIGDALHCQPIAYFWHQWDGEHKGHCADFNAITWAHSSINIAIDVVMLIMPIHQIRKLNMHWKKKLSVSLMFCVGSFITVLSILRVQSLVIFARTTNITWDFWPICLWSSLELYIGIFCACMPSLKILLRIPFPGLFGGGSHPSTISRPGTSSGMHIQQGRIQLTRTYNVKFDGAEDDDEEEVVRGKDEEDTGSVVNLVEMERRKQASW